MTDTTDTVTAPPAPTWVAWAAANTGTATSEEALAALREFIVKSAKEEIDGCSYDAAWANKKLAKLGITERIQVTSAYDLSVPVTGVIELRVWATSRAEALTKAAERLDGTGAAHVRDIAGDGIPSFLKGPEDATTDVADDAPQTVDATLAKLREIILLGHIAGPKICETEANRVLASFGLAPIPARKTFTVTRPVEATMVTTVEAYDEESAMRIAGWRWEDGRSGYTMTPGQGTDAPSVAAAN